MPYHSRAELPKGVRDVLPEHAQDIWKEAYNHALIEYENPAKRRTNEGREEVAAKVAWAAVKHHYEKGHNDKWRKKG